jgi:hypothetical protein
VRKASIALVIALATAGCGIALTHGPPAPCTRNRTGPLVDLALAGLSGLVMVVAAAGEPDSFPHSKQFGLVAGGFSGAAIFTVSGVVGLRKVNRCRRAMEG